MVGKGYLVGSNGTDENRLWKIERYSKEALEKYLEGKESETSARKRSPEKIAGGKEHSSRARKSMALNAMRQIVDPTDLISLMQIAIQGLADRGKRAGLMSAAKEMIEMLPEREEKDHDEIKYRTAAMVSKFQRSLRDSIPRQVYAREFGYGTEGVKVAGISASSVIDKLYPLPSVRSRDVDSWIRKASENFPRNRGMVQIGARR